MLSHSKKFHLAAALLLSLALGACAGMGQSSGQFVDDSLITTKIKTKLIGDMMLKGFTIKVDTVGGTVQLGGTVDTATQKQRAEEVVNTVEGVKAIKNEIAVKQ